MIYAVPFKRQVDGEAEGLHYQVKVESGNGGTNIKLLLDANIPHSVKCAAGFTKNKHGSNSQSTLTQTRPTWRGA